MTRRIFRGLAAASLLAALTAGAASAGGWATITADPGSQPQPNAGEPFTFGFTVLQHGVTPAGWEEATVVAISGSTGRRVEVRATVDDVARGHFTATVSLPEAGYWTWQVELRDLVVQTRPQPLTVANADGSPPAMDAPAVLAAMERMRAEIRTELGDRLRTEAESLRAEVDALSARGSTGVPLPGVIAIAVLAGALSGFAVTMLGRRDPAGPTAGPTTAEAASPAGALTSR